MDVVLLCDAYGWTYQEYIMQPKWFIELLVGKRMIDAKQNKAKKPGSTRK